MVIVILPIIFIGNDKNINSNLRRFIRKSKSLLL